jgi:phosphate transport system substrate-binding protein
MSPLKLSVSALALALAATSAHARDQVQVAGSSSVLPFAGIVAEAFGENFEFPAPVVEGGGTSAGIQRFCEGVGETYIDIVTASRPMRPSEWEHCQANGVTEIGEVRIGYDGIVFASAVGGPEFAFTPEHWFNALAARVLVDGALVDNPHSSWAQVDPALPDQEILAFIPGTKHGTRDVFEEKVILEGCEASGAMEAFMAEGMDEDAAEEACLTLRTDGRSVDIDGDYSETLARLEADANGIGVFGLTFYQNNRDVLRVATMDGVVPSVETIASGEYPISRPLFIYVKNAHLDMIPGLPEFVEFWVSDDMSGPEGPLAAFGLVADPALAETQAAVAARTVMAPPAS